MKSYVVAERTDDDAALVARVALLSRLGADYVQLRDKRSTVDSVTKLARALRPHVSGRLIINSHAHVARAVAADGVHLPAGAPMIDDILMVGRSCHSLADCQRAAEEGADYVLLGPVFATRSKASAPRVTLGDLRAAASLGPEVFALGGITVDTLPELARCGISGVAAITLFMRDEPIAEIMELIRTL